jgi:hypothetical protein
MSRIYKVISPKPIDVHSVFDAIKGTLYPPMKYQDLEDGMYLIHQQACSIRGLMIYFEDDVVHIKVPANANVADYGLLNEFATHCYYLYKCYFIDNEENKYEKPNLVSREQATQYFADEYFTLKSLVQQYNSFASIFCPNCEFYIGLRLLKYIAHESITQKRTEVDLFEGIVRNKINLYNSPHLHFNQLMMMEPTPNSSNNILIAALSNQGYSLIQKVDYFMVILEGEKFCTVEAEVVYNNHPETWRMIDEFEMTLSELSVAKWQAFYNEVALPNDIKENLEEHLLKKKNT